MMGDVYPMDARQTTTAGPQAVEAEVAPAVADAQPAQPVPAALTETQRLKAENFMLRVQLARMAVERQERDINDERRALEAEFRSSLNPAADAEWDWERLTFVPQKG